MVCVFARAPLCVSARANTGTLAQTSTRCKAGASGGAASEGVAVGWGGGVGEGWGWGVDVSQDEKESLISREENIRAHVCGARLCVISVHLRNATQQTAPSAGLILSATDRESVVSATRDTLRISVHVLFKATLEKGVCMATAHSEGLHHDAKLLYADFSSNVGHPGCRVILRIAVLLWQ